MEVEGLGARCALPSCRRLDYLPLQCASCSQKFCEEHSLPSSHSCTAAPSNIVPTCPICECPVPVPSTMSANDAMARHIDAGCPKRHRSNPECALPTCHVRDAAATACVACGRMFCLAHCLEPNHDCTAMKTKAHGIFGAGRGAMASTSRMQQAGRTTSAGRAGSSSTPKVTLGSARKTKAGSAVAAAAVTQRASGKTPGRLDFANAASKPLGDSSVESEDRMSLSVYFPASTDIQPRHMYFSRRHSAGKIIDVLHKLIPALPQPPTGSRYSLYAVKSDLARVNLLPYIRPLRELGDIVGSGDSIIVQVGDSGLDHAWLSALQTRAPVFAATPFGKLAPKMPFRKGNRCLVA